MSKTQVSCTIEPDVQRAIREAAEAEGRTFSAFVNLILKRYAEHNSMFGQ